jgi:two-component system, LytTR family, response regulator
VIRAAIVDDEEPARDKVRRLLAKQTDVEVVGEAADGSEAVALIRRTSPDVVFLDIQMPRLDGFGVVEEIGVDRAPLLVFVTAYDEHAVRAFEVCALDYLLKPFAPSRFNTVLARVRAQLAHATAPEWVARVERALTLLERRPATVPRLLVERSPNRQILLSLEAVTLVRAKRNYLRFVTRDGEYTRRGTLAELEETLDRERFLRINRSEIVRLDAVAEIQPWFHGDARIRMADGSTLTWSRRYRGRDLDRF